LHYAKHEIARLISASQKWLSPGGGHSFRIGSGVAATIGAENTAGAPWRGSNGPECCHRQAIAWQQRKSRTISSN
jgi:hypothetical protein